jgi:hypothetical protein
VKFVKHRIDVKPQERIHITPYSDVHFNDTSCAIEKWRKHYHERASLERSYFLNLGDFNGLILPNDLKRFKPSGQVIVGVDNILNKEIETTIDLIKSEPQAQWLLWGTGNHEDEIEKRHYYNLPMAIADRLAVPYGAYCGVLFLHLTYNKQVRTLIIAYHHGAWGGIVIKGLGGATRYFNTISPWHIALFGHNHTAIHDIQPIVQVSERGYISTINRHIVNTGGWMQQAKQDDNAVSFSERRGYPLAPLICPLITAWLERGRRKEGYILKYEVTY